MDRDTMVVRRSQSSMISNDETAPSSCPQSVVMKPYPDLEYVLQGDYPDYLEAVDRDSNEAVKGIRKQLSKKKY